MKFKTTWLAIVVFGALGAYLYRVDQPGQRASQAAKDKEGLLFADLDPARVTEILLRGKKGKIRVRKGDKEQWSVLEPVEDTADSGKIRSLLEDLKALKAEKEVAKTGGDLKPFGLDVPEFVIKTTGQPVTLAIGSENPSGDGRYVQDVGGSVKVVKSYLLTGLLVAPDALRSKEILGAFPWDRLQSVTVTDAGSLALKLAKVGGRWRIEAPVTLEADPDAAEALPEKLHWAKITSFLPEDAGAAQQRFAKGISVVLTAEGRAGPAVVQLAPVEGAIWGLAQGRNAVFTIEKAVFDVFHQKPEDLRRRKPVFAKTWSAEKLKITSSGKSVTYEKTEGAWRKRGATVRGEEGEALRLMLQNFEEQKANRIISPAGPDASYGLDAPKVSLKISDSQNAEQLLQIGEKDHIVYARSGLSGPVYVMGQRDYLTRVLALLKLSDAPVVAPGGATDGAPARKP